MSVHPAASGIWCSTCKEQWGKLDNGKRWHPRAMTQAVATTVSEIRNPGLMRHYCQNHMDEFCTQPDGSYITLKEYESRAKELIHV